MTEEEIILSLQKENTEALGELIDKYTPYISAVIFRIIGGKTEDCRELTADVFYSAWVNRDKLKNVFTEQNNKNNRLSVLGSRLFLL